MDWIASEYRMRMPSNYIKPDSCFDQHYNRTPATNRNWFSPEDKVIAGTGNLSDLHKEDCRGSFNYDYISNNLTEYKNCSDFPKLLPDTLNCTDCTPDCTTVEDFANSCRNGTISGCSTNTTDWASQKYDKCAFNQTYVGKKGKNETTWEECRLEGAEGFSYNIYQCQDKEGHLGVCANNCKGVNPNSIIIGGFAPIAVAGLAGQAFLQPALLGAAGLGLGAVGVGAMGVGPVVTDQCPNSRPCRVREHIIILIVILTTVCFAGSRSKQSEAEEMLQLTVVKVSQMSE